MWVLLHGVASAAPATVLDHRLDVVVGKGGATTVSLTWVVRVDDAGACAAGLAAPPGLDGAEDLGARVFEDFVVFPGTLADGASYTFARTEHLAGPYASGEFRAAPDLPIEHASVRVRAPPGLAVWADEGAHASFSHGSTDEAVFEWSHAEDAQAAWTTWPGWEDVAAHHEVVLRDRGASREVLGGLAPQGVNVDAVLGRVRAALEVTPDEGSLEEARPVADVLRPGPDTPFEAALALTNVLRTAGFEAQIALFRPEHSRHTVPALLPAPALLPDPLVVVRDDRRTRYIDPASPRAGDVPASLLDAVVWLPGDLPHRVFPSGLVAARVVVTVDARIGTDGSWTWTSYVTAEDAAAEALRNRLADLDPDSRTRTLERLVRVGHPEADRIAVTATGLNRADEELNLTVSGHAPLLSPLGGGGVGSLRATLGPALSAWLPPGLEVVEIENVEPPPGTHWTSLVPPPTENAANAYATTRVDRVGDRAVVITTSSLPRGQGSTEIGAEILHRHGTSGTKVLALPPMTATVGKALAVADPLTPAQRAAIEAVAWWDAGQPRRARTALIRGMSLGVDELARAMDHAPPGDERPYALLAELTQLDENRLAVAAAARRAHLYDLAWRLTATVANETQKPDVKLDALLRAQELQPDVAPDPARDPGGAALWLDPEHAANLALTAASRCGREEDPSLHLLLAEQALVRGDLASAAPHLAGVRSSSEAAPEHRAAAEVLGAQLDAHTGAPLDQVTRRIRDAVAGLRQSGAVMARASEVAAAVGAPNDAEQYAIAAARADPTSPDAWLALVDRALAAGNLDTAVHAARAASDLDPGDARFAEPLRLLGTLALDRDIAALGAKRAGTELPDWPPSFDELLATVPPDGLLALLAEHDERVAESPTWLALRAGLALLTDPDLATRDATLLERRYGDPEGSLLRAAAVVGRIWAPSQPLLGTLADGVSAGAKLEWALWTSGDAGAVARAHPQDARMAAVNGWIAAPTPPGWPDGLRDRKVSGPKGWLPNRVVGAPPGALAWSEPTTGQTAIVVDAPLDAPVFPLVPALYTAEERPVATWTGGTVARQQGGVLPLYVASGSQESRTVFGVGFSVRDAVSAAEVAAGVP